MIDLRSDTVTKPSKEMLNAMLSANVGDDVYKEDPTINHLEEYAADLLGFESALFVPSGVMGNQICLNVHTQPGDEVLCESDAHIFQYESGSPAALSGIQLNPIKGNNGILEPESIVNFIRPESAYYMPRSRVLEIENSHNRAGGSTYSIQQIKDLKEITNKYKLKFHMDGARLWNASVANNIILKDYCKYLDSVSVCLSKGLGAPIGSIIAGNKDFINKAFRLRKAWGGGMRQVGIIGAAGLYALNNNINRLSEDHEKTKILANNISEMKNFEIINKNVETNILIFKPLKVSIEESLLRCKEHGLLLSVGQVGTLRAVTHMDISFKDIDKTTNIINKLFN